MKMPEINVALSVHDDASDVLTAADLGTACAWIEVFARVVVPLGGHVWRTDEPEVGRWVTDMDGSVVRIGSRTRARRWAEVSRRYPELYAWRYLDEREVPDT